jgi:hypothetical protein
MDLHVDPSDSAEKRGLTFPNHREAMTEACVEILRKLGKIGNAIQAFRVEFSYENTGNPNCANVEITIYFEDMLDKKRTRKMSYSLGPHCEPGVQYREIAYDLLRDGTLEKCLRTLVEESHSTHQEQADKLAGML